jgi:hypothetical protein
MNGTVRIALALALSFVAGCRGTGGTVGGLFPAPKFLDGTVNNGIYLAPEKAFSVRLPHPPTGDQGDQYEWRYSRVHEIEDEAVIGVLFGPAALDLSVYHAVLIRTPMEGNKDETVERLFSWKVGERRDNFERTTTQVFTLNGRTCHYAVYESPKAFLVLSLTDAGDSFFAIEADIPKTANAFVPESAQVLVDREWPMLNAMLESFVPGPIP